jgi:hypothetical protein
MDLAGITGFRRGGRDWGLCLFDTFTADWLSRIETLATLPDFHPRNGWTALVWEYDDFLLIIQDY